MGADRLRRAADGAASGGDGVVLRGYPGLSRHDRHRRLRRGIVLDRLRKRQDHRADSGREAGPSGGRAPAGRRLDHGGGDISGRPPGILQVGRQHPNGVPVPEREAGGRRRVPACGARRRIESRWRVVLLPQRDGAVSARHRHRRYPAGEAGGKPALCIYGGVPPYGECAGAVVYAVAVQQRVRHGAGGSGQREVPDASGHSAGHELHGIRHQPAILQGRGEL